MDKTILGCLVLALIATVMYFLTGAHIIEVPTLNPANDLTIRDCRKSPFLSLSVKKGIMKNQNI